MSDDKNNQQEQTLATDDSSTEAPSMSEVQRLKEKNQRLQAMLTDKEKQYSTFASMYKDIDPDEYRTLKQKLEEREREAAEKDPRAMEDLFQRKLDKIRSELETEKTTLESRLEEVLKINKNLAVTDKVMGEISTLFNQDAQKWIKREVEESCDIDEDGSIVVKDENGDVLYKGARPMTVKEYGELLVQKYPSLAKASGVGGVKDATPGQKAGVRLSGKTPQSWAELQSMPNAKEVLERLKREDPAAVQKILRTMPISAN
jgi:predicted RNase H-like nuclease (RuvC/YqgF family)